MVHDFDLAGALLGPARRVHARAAAGGRHVTALVEHERGEAAVEGSHAMPASFPFTAGLRVLCERGVLEHRFEARRGRRGRRRRGGARCSRSTRRTGEPRRFHEAGRSVGRADRALPRLRRGGAEPRDGSFAQARAALAVALAARRSIASGAPGAGLTRAQ